MLRFAEADLGSRPKLEPAWPTLEFGRPVPAYQVSGGSTAENRMFYARKARQCKITGSPRPMDTTRIHIR